METSDSNSSYGIHIAVSRFIRTPLAALFQYSVLLIARRSSSSSSWETDGLIPTSTASLDSFQYDHDSSSPASPREEVSIRIIDAGEQEREAITLDNDRSSSDQISEAPAVSDISSSSESTSGVNSGGPTANGEPANGGGVNDRGSFFRGYEYQQFIRELSRLTRQILPFSLLLLVVFIRQHLQGFFVTIWIALVMFKSEDILKTQKALKGERKLSVLACFTAVLMIHVICVYWWYGNNDLLPPLLLLPPKAIPPFCHAIYIIMVNDTMVRLAAMALKCMLLIFYRNSRGRDYSKQGQMLTLVGYVSLLYRALLPTPVWYRFFLNKEYGSLFSSLTTGLYLTFKLPSFVEKVQSFFAALGRLSRNEVHYGSFATSEQVTVAGDLCAICQENMHPPILLRCKHIFCEDCVSEWFERERTCPLCRALVKPPADIRLYGAGIQLF